MIEWLTSIDWRFHAVPLTLVASFVWRVITDDEPSGCEVI